MKDTMRSKLTQLVRRLEEIDQNLQDPDVTSNMDQFRALSKERAEIEPVVLKAKEYERAEEDLAAAEEMLSDEEMKEFASEEIKAAKKAIEQISSELEILLLPKDPNDDKNIYLEIRAAQAVTSPHSLRRFVQNVFPLCRTSEMAGGICLCQPFRLRRLQRNRCENRGPRCIFQTEV